MSPAPRGAAAAGTVTAVAVLLMAAPAPGAALRQVRDAGAAADPTAPLVALLSLLAWALAGWLLLTVAATTGGHLPGRAGRLLRALARRVAPVAVRRTIEATLGLTVAVGALGASPALASPGPPTGPASAPVAASLDWAAPAPDSAPGLDWAPAPPADPPTPEAVVVQPGDTLWHLAEHDLTAQGMSAPSEAEVAQAWPSWWAANREAIGDDPDLLQPGTALTPPDEPPPAPPRQ
jgi:nucleoid-associated protein YgaU